MAEELNIRGLTGVDVTLRIAGPGTRAYAFLIDWHIRLLLAMAWVSVGLLVTRYKYTTHLFQYAFALPATLLYLLYHPVLEVLMRGRTPGKRAAGARLVTQEGATPGVGALLMRNVFRVIDMLPGIYTVGMVCCASSSQRVRIGDLAAGTVLVLDAPQTAHSLDTVGTMASNSRLNPDTAALVRDLLDRWREMDARGAVTLARSILLRVDGELSPVQLEAAGSTALRSRLEGLLAGTVPVRGTTSAREPRSSPLDPGGASAVRDLLGRWQGMDASQAAMLARNILLRFDGQLDPVQAQALDGQALRARLEKLLARA